MPILLQAVSATIHHSLLTNHAFGIFTGSEPVRPARGLGQPVDGGARDGIAHRLRQADAMADRHVDRLRVGPRPQYGAYRLALVREGHPGSAPLHGLAVLADEPRFGDADRG